MKPVDELPVHDPSRNDPSRGDPSCDGGGRPSDSLEHAHLNEHAISPAAYRWTARLFGVVRRMLGVNVIMHHDAGQLEGGDIFAFNHFARFETFIPQYILYERLGVESRAIASAEFFETNDTLSRYLRSVGALPNNMPGLLPFLAAEILRGRKLVVFPEGGMVKDRRVLDGGKLSVYSRTAGERRKHHAGPAVLALVLDAFKSEVRRARRDGELGRLDDWAGGLDLPSREALLNAAERPTRIVPCNITFYPIRVDQHVLATAVERLAGGISRRAMEELLVEGNILLRHTDMDIRLGDAVEAASYWGKDDRKLMTRIARRFRTLDDFFVASCGELDWRNRVLGSTVSERVYQIRDEYMQRMYQSVTINLSHLASSLIMQFVEIGVTSLPLSEFRQLLYELVKRTQSELGLHLHRGLIHPDGYAGLIDGVCAGFEQFFKAKSAMGLLAVENDELRFTEQLQKEHDFDEVRLTNLVSVYANEVAPIERVRFHVRELVIKNSPVGPAALSMQRFDDEVRRFSLDREAFSRPEHQELNSLETATRSGEPYLLLPSRDAQQADAPESRLGVVLVHGFLASPAELAELGAALNERGHPVLGVRLSGHGTSPWDLHERTVEDWLASVATGQRVMAGLAPRQILVGFSTGGTLALIRAGSEPESVAGVGVVNVPAGFVDPRMRLAGLVHGVNVVFGSMTGTDGIMPFRPNQSENPDINYASIPVSGLRELNRSVALVKAAVSGIRAPVLMLQSNEDPVVDAQAARTLAAQMTGAAVHFKPVQSNIHGILHHKVPVAWESIFDFVARRTADAGQATSPAPE
jgi:esterase/lipase